MRKQNLLKKAALIALAFCLLFSAACDSNSTKENSEQTKSETIADIKTDNSTPAASAVSSAAEPESQPSETAPESKSDIIEKITGAADDTGIYAVVITLSDNAADKGVIEMVYYGPKNSPQENSVVNTFRIEYYKEDAGTFEIHTFYDGEVYQNYHHKDKVKVDNTFGAAVRARNVIISYTPDGGETQEIYRADAEQFFIPAN